MKWYKNMNIAGKLILLIMPFIVAVAGLLVFFAYRSYEINSQSKQALYDEAFVSTASILNADRDFYQAAIVEKEMYLRFDSLNQNDKDAFAKDYELNVKQVYDRINAAIKNISGNKELYSYYRSDASGKTLEQLGQSFNSNFNQWKAAYSPVTNSGDINKKQALFDSAREEINQMTEILEKYAQKRSVEILQEVDSSIRLCVIIFTAVLAILGCIAAYLIRLIRGSVRYVTDFCRRIASGDLDVEINEKMITKDEIGMLVSTLNNEVRDAFERIDRARINLDVAADEVAKGVRQISDGSQTISQGATEQASSLEEVSSTVTQIAAQTKQNAESAERANKLSVEAMNAASQGNEQMSSMLRAMNDISDSSSNISRIMKVVDDIAFQTNILALNAAVEAARAGVYGKSFAVVAEEVRNLATRSANAAKETTELIESSIKSVQAGTHIAGDTAKSLKTILERVEEATQLVGEITISSNEQANAIAEINTALDQLSIVVQNNSATAEETAAASEELASQAELLRQMVESLNLKRESE